MAGIKDLDAVAGNNDSAPPDGAPEGMLAVEVNNIQRQQMANAKNDVVYRVPLLVDLKALDSLKQAEGSGITLSGLTVVGEGGGVFYYDSTSSATSDDNYVVEPTDTLGRWLRDRGDGTSKVALLAFNSSTDVNVTGDGTAVTVDYDTEIFDQGSDFSADTFIARVTGKYLIICSAYVTGLTSSHTTGTLQLVTSNRTYLGAAFDPFAVASTTNTPYRFSQLADMDAGDTATATITVAGGTKVVDISSGADIRTQFSAILLA